MLLLATSLPRCTRFDVRVCALGTGGPRAKVLEKDGITLQELGWRRRLDVRPLWSFRKSVLDYSPDIVHAWDVQALWMLRLACAGKFRLIASSAGRGSAPRGILAWLTGQLLRNADAVVAQGHNEIAAYRRGGLAPEKINFIPRAVDAASMQEPGQATLRRSLRLSEKERLIVCVGPLLAEKGYYDAIWAFDILNYLYDNLHLALIGSGPYRGRLEAFVHAIQCAARVHLIGPQPEVLPLMAQADVVWVPGRTRSGANAALEAMAAGRPLVAARLPAVAELVNDGATGFLVPPGDKGALARQTRLVLDDGRLAQKLGEAGRRHVIEEFNVSTMVQRHAQLYERLVGGLES
jgi:glycosyltransferase involved in cell wall biosynthesis